MRYWIVDRRSIQVPGLISLSFILLAVIGTIPALSLSMYDFAWLNTPLLAVFCLYSVFAMLFGLGAFAVDHYARNGFPVLGMWNNAKEGRERIFEAICFYIFYIVSFWKNRRFLIFYLLVLANPLFLITILGAWALQAIRLSYMIEIATANRDLPVPECAKRSREITRGKFWEQLWLHARLAVGPIIILCIPSIFIAASPHIGSLSLLWYILLAFYYYFIIMLACKAFSLARITCLETYVSAAYGHGAFSPGYFFSKDNYGKRWRGWQGAGDWHGRTDYRRDAAKQPAGQGQRLRHPRAYYQQYSGNVFDTDDGEVILDRLWGLSQQYRYYKMLGLDARATPGEVKDAYRKLAMRFHPDRHAANTRRQWLAGEIFKYINDAYSKAIRNARPRPPARPPRIR